MFCMLKKKKYILFMFENITQIVKNALFFNDFKWRKTPSLVRRSQRMTLTLSCIKKLSALVRGITSKNIIV